MSLQKAWFTNAKWVWVLLPLTILFWLLSSFRRLLFKVNLKSSYRSSAKIIVVGNISVGGNGKTPTVIALANYFKTRNINVGVLSRGYGGTQTNFPCIVDHNSIASKVGDEPKLMAHRLGCPVVIDPKRSRGAKYLTEHFHCDVIICDDGLQHYALKRDFEIVVMDSRGLGNGYLMPMGPLRESEKRLQCVDAIVLNSATESRPFTSSVACVVANMELSPTRWVNLKTREVRAFLEVENAIAIAGIGDPKRFFSTLESMNIKVDECVGYPDHYEYKESDIPQRQVLMTEKDAVKIQHFAHEDCWYLEVNGDIDGSFYQAIENKLALSS